MKRLLVFLLALAPAPAICRVLDFHSDIRLAPSGEVTVTERITAQTEQGAYTLVRDLPHGAKVLDVVRNGHPVTHVIEGDRLRVGGPVPAGRYFYQLTYRAPRAVRFMGGLDELRWTVKGSGLAVERLTAEVTLPARVPPRDIRAESTLREHQSFVRDGRAAFRALRPLESHEPMVITVRFPKDVVAAPSFGQQARWLAADYAGLLAVAIGLGLTAWTLLHIRNLSAKP
ncbi:MAG TPA: DUF2207 domain-containing protein [Burkholderiales bacterium]|jgi:hypothetical protein|nr:DUF2207 domain-containing protein [Burkholderiales bacterium]